MFFAILCRSFFFFLVCLGLFLLLNLLILILSWVAVFSLKVANLVFPLTLLIITNRLTVDNYFVYFIFYSFLTVYQFMIIIAYIVVV